MSKKAAVLDSFQPKVTRTDRFVQMSQQEKIIEQKKKEILAKLEAKEKASKAETKSKSDSSKLGGKSLAPSSSSTQKDVKNIFNNDGSFLDQFKQIKESKKLDSKKKSLIRRDHERSFKDDKNKSNRWTPRRRSPSPKERPQKRVSRFSVEKITSEPKITINTSFSTALSHQNFDFQAMSVTSQSVSGQPLLKNMLPAPVMTYPNVIQQPTINEMVITAAPVLLDAPNQIVQGQISSTLVLTQAHSTQNLFVTAPMPPAVTAVNLASYVTTSVTSECSLPSIEISSITTPNSIHLHNIPQPAPLNALNVPQPESMLALNIPQSESINTLTILQSEPTNTLNIPQPEPINTLNIPQPEPINVLNIPQPEPISMLNIPHPEPISTLNIPQPEPINALNIPQPGPIKALNIPQPAPIQVHNIPTPASIQLNEIPNPKPLDLLAIPTPNEVQGLSDHDFLKNIPPPNKTLPMPTMQETTISILPHTVSTSISIPSNQNLLVHNIQPTQIQTIHNIHHAVSASQILQQQQPSFTSVTVTVPVSVVQVSTAPMLPSAIPSLMAQPILPPPGMGININMTCPPPILPMQTSGSTLSPFLHHPPPLPNQMPSMNIPPPTGMLFGGMGSMRGFKDMNAVFPPGTAEYESMASLGRMVAKCGQSIEDIVRQRKSQDPNLWFLFHKESMPYQQYRQLIEQFKLEDQMMKLEEERDTKHGSGDMYEPEMALEDNESVTVKNEIKNEAQEDESADGSEKKRKRKSRWGVKDTNVPPPSLVMYNTTPLLNPGIPPMMPVMQQKYQPTVMLSKVTRTDPGLLQYAMNTYGSTNLTDEDWKKAEDNYKISLLYQDMLKKREEVKRLQMSGKNKYDYDSDEEVDGGTWEHKAREKEMMATDLWATELTRQAEGKHHIGDFLPPEELKRFMEKSSAVKEGRQPNFSDYKEFKLKEDNIGFQMLQKLGWSEGEGLGTGGMGILNPINKAAPREQTQGFGLNQMDEDEDEYESYRKRMMLAYRFRPNPLNNPRRPYY